MTTQNVPQNIPLADLKAAAKSDGASIVPLHLIEVGTDQYKVAIRVLIVIPDDAGNKNNHNGENGQLYEFDTGGNGFWLDGSKLMVPAGATETACIQYFSGKTYVAKAVPASIEFPDMEFKGSWTAPLTATVGVIQQYYQCPPGQKTDPETPDLAPSPCTPASFPIFGQCYGDFGAALNMAGKEFSGTASLMSPLGQLALNYADPCVGFIVAAPQSVETPGCLILGFGEHLRALFPQTVAMVPGESNYVDPYNPGNTFLTFSEQLVNGTLTVGRNAPPVAVGICLDTGEPVTTLHGGSTLTIGPQETPNYAAKSGDRIVLTAPNAQSTDENPLPDVTLLSFTADQPNPVANVDSSKNNTSCPSGYINTGLSMFLQCPVMYDLHRKVVGLPPAIVYT